MTLTTRDAQDLSRCLRVGGVAVFPADTVYGMCCDPQDKEAVRRLYALKHRPIDKPSAVMFFTLEPAIAALPWLGEITRDALTRLLPGPIGVVLPNPEHRYALACGDDPGSLGLRVPALPAAALALSTVPWPVLQSSANLAGSEDPRQLDDVPEAVRAAVDLVLDAGPLPGTPSTMVDLREYEEARRYTVLREGAVAAGEIATILR